MSTGTRPNARSKYACREDRSGRSRPSRRARDTSRSPLVAPARRLGRRPTWSTTTRRAATSSTPVRTLRPVYGVGPRYAGDIGGGPSLFLDAADNSTSPTRTARTPASSTRADSPRWAMGTKPPRPGNWLGCSGAQSGRGGVAGFQRALRRPGRPPSALRPARPAGGEPRPRRPAERRAPPAWTPDPRPRALLRAARRRRPTPLRRSGWVVAP